MTLEEITRLHSPNPITDSCGCGRPFATGDQWMAHLCEEIRAAFFLITRAEPHLGEPEVMLSNTGHLAVVAFPFTDDDAPTVRQATIELAQSLVQAFE